MPIVATPQITPGQFIIGTDVDLYVGELAPPLRVSATRDANKILTITGEPTNSYLIRGATSTDFSADKSNTEYLVLDGDGWMDSRSVAQGFAMSMSAYFPRSANFQDIETAFGIIENAGSAEIERELYFKTRKFLTLVSGNNRFLTRVGSAVVTDYQESMPADNLIEVSWTFRGRGILYTGIESVPPGS